MAEIFLHFLFGLLGIGIFVLFFSATYLTEMDKQREPEVPRKEVKEPELPHKSFAEKANEIWACFMACIMLIGEKMGFIEYNTENKEWKWK